HRQTLLADKVHKAKVQERWVRCLVHAQRLDEARRAADTLPQGEDGKPLSVPEFQQCVNRALGDQDAASAQFLAEAMRALRPKDPDVLCCLARATGRARKLDEALRLYQAALELQSDAAKRQEYNREMLLDAVDAGKPLEG